MQNFYSSKIQNIIIESYSPDKFRIYIYADDLTLFQRAIVELTTKKDNKIRNTLFHCNPNASNFDSRSLNEDIPQDNKRFTKLNDMLWNETRTVS